MGAAGGAEGRGVVTNEQIEAIEARLRRVQVVPREIEGLVLDSDSDTRALIASVREARQRIAVLETAFGEVSTQRDEADTALAACQSQAAARIASLERDCHALKRAIAPASAGPEPWPGMPPLSFYVSVAEKRRALSLKIHPTDAGVIAKQEAP